MGVAKNIGIDQWPRQFSNLNRRCKVIFNYDTSREVMGTIVRDDGEEPWRCIIRLDDGRVVLSTECQYQPID